MNLTRFLLLILVFLLVLCSAQIVLAQNFDAPTQSDWELLVSNIKDAGSPTWFMLMFVVVQSLFLIARTMLGEILGIYKLLVLAILSSLVTIGTNITAGKSLFESILLDSGTLMAYQVLIHELSVQWKRRNEDRARIALSRNRRMRKRQASK